MKAYRFNSLGSLGNIDFCSAGVKSLFLIVNEISPKKRKATHAQLDVLAKAGANNTGFMRIRDPLEKW